MFAFKRLSATGEARIAGPAVLGTVNVNTPTAAAVLTIYNSTAASGDVVAVIDASSGVSRGYLVYCDKGIYAEMTGANADITIGYT